MGFWIILTTVVLDESEVWEVSPHVALDAMEGAKQRGDLVGQHGAEEGVAVDQ